MVKLTGPFELHKIWDDGTYLYYRARTNLFHRVQVLKSDIETISVIPDTTQPSLKSRLCFIGKGTTLTEIKLYTPKAQTYQKMLLNYLKK